MKAAITKLEKKSCNLIVLNGPEAINAQTNQVEVINRGGKVIKSIHGDKAEVAASILRIIQSQLIDASPSTIQRFD